MKILYFNNGSGLGTAKSGGTTRLIETARHFLKSGNKVKIVTTIGAYKLFRKERLNTDFLVLKSSIFRNYESGNLDRIISYVISTIHSLMSLSKMGNYDVVYSCSDYFCDVIPAVLYKKKYKKKYISMIHHLSKPPRERKGNYLINSISYYFQKISHLIIKKYSDLIFLYDTDEGRLIAKNFPNNKIKYVANGIDFDLINSIYVEERKKYAETVVKNFWQSMGGDENEIADLDQD